MAVWGVDSAEFINFHTHSIADVCIFFCIIPINNILYIIIPIFNLLMQGRKRHAQFLSSTIMEHTSEIGFNNIHIQTGYFILIRSHR